jgi:hypothetical protein
MLPIWRRFTTERTISFRYGSNKGALPSQQEPHPILFNPIPGGQRGRRPLPEAIRPALERLGIAESTLWRQK